MLRKSIVTLLAVLACTATAQQLGPVQAAPENPPVTIFYSLQGRSWQFGRGSQLIPVTEGVFDTLARLDKEKRYNCVLTKATSMGDGSWGGLETRIYYVVSINCGQ